MAQEHVRGCGFPIWILLSGYKLQPLTCGIYRTGIMCVFIATQPGSPGQSTSTTVTFGPCNVLRKYPDEFQPQLHDVPAGRPAGSTVVVLIVRAYIMSLLQHSTLLHFAIFA